MQTSSKIRYPIDAQNRLPDVERRVASNLFISGHSSDKSLSVIFTRQDNPKNWLTELNPSSLAAETTLIHDVLERVTSARQGHQHIEELARLGRGLFLSLIPDEEYRNFFINEISSSDFLNVHTDQFSLPINVLYLNDLNSKVDPLGFLGFRLPIIRSIISTESDSSSAEVKSTIIAGWSDTPPRIEATEISKIKRLFQSEKAHEDSWTEISPYTGSSIIDNALMFNQAIESAQSIFVHFACHAETGNTREQSKFLLRNDTYISVNDLHVSEFKLTNSQIVFFNACETSQVSALEKDGFPLFFIKKGASCYIGSDAPVDTDSAAIFSRRFYRKTLKQELVVMDAVFNASVELIRWNIFAGLSYACFGRGLSSVNSFRKIGEVIE